MRLSMALAASVLFSSPLLAQETSLGADFRKEGERFGESCGAFKLVNCAQLLFTDHPLHIAVGSLAPLNGFGSGIAFTAHYTPNETWRLFWNADAIATPNGSWRAGGYMSAVLIRRPKITIGTGSPGNNKPSLTLPEMPVFHAYVQNTSLNTISYYGLGQATTTSHTLFGMSEAIVGGNVVWPVTGRLNMSLLGEANGRFSSIRASHQTGEVSIEQTNTERHRTWLIHSAGLRSIRSGNSHPSQPGERVRPSGLHSEFSGMGGEQLYLLVSSLQGGSLAPVSLVSKYPFSVAQGIQRTRHVLIRPELTRLPTGQPQSGG